MRPEDQTAGEKNGAVNEALNTFALIGKAPVYKHSYDVPFLTASL